MRSNEARAIFAARGGRRVNWLLRRYGPAELDRLMALMRPDEMAVFDRQAGTLQAWHVQAVLLGDAGYPRALAESPQAPAALFHVGPIELLKSPVLAVCGAHEGGGAGDGELIAAKTAARIAVDSGLAVVSGDRGGVGGAAVLAALRSGGTAGVVLAEMVGRGMRGGLPHDARADSDRLVTMSQVPPGLPWSIDTAMARNATLAGLCTALVAVAAGSTGGTIDAGQQALAAGKPVLAVGDTAGSRLLVDHGATPARDHIELAWWLDRLRSDHEDLADVRGAAG
jgi:predicted Rossmann fold nucleotide-binding protein DprA/Smf involved in DNA uptake